MLRILIYDNRIIKNSERKDSIKAMEIFKNYKLIRRIPYEEYYKSSIQCCLIEGGKLNEI